MNVIEITDIVLTLSAAAPLVPTELDVPAPTAKCIPPPDSPPIAPRQTSIANIRVEFLLRNADAEISALVSEIRRGSLFGLSIDGQSRAGKTDLKTLIERLRRSS